MIDSALTKALSGREDEVLSTRRVAELLRVSEATIKRWSDEGLITCQRTPGGHRKFRRADVRGFLERHHFAVGQGLLEPQPLAADDVIRLGLAGDASGLVASLRAVLDAGDSLEQVLDERVAPALQEVGERWACAGLSVAEEHLVSTTITDVLGRLGEDLTLPPARGTAVVGCLSGEHHQLGARMAALVLRHHGYRVLATGADTPTIDLLRLAREQQARLVALSAVYSDESAQLIEQVAQALRADDVRFIVGGAAIATKDALPEGVELAASMRAFGQLLETAPRA